MLSAVVSATGHCVHHLLRLYVYVCVCVCACVCAFRDQHESMAAGFKFGYWGQQKFSPHHVFTKPLRTWCV